MAVHILFGEIRSISVLGFKIGVQNSMHSISCITLIMRILCLEQ